MCFSFHGCSLKHTFCLVSGAPAPRGSPIGRQVPEWFALGYRAGAVMLLNELIKPPDGMESPQKATIQELLDAQDSRDRVLAHDGEFLKIMGCSADDGVRSLCCLEIASVHEVVERYGLIRRRKFTWLFGAAMAWSGRVPVKVFVWMECPYTKAPPARHAHPNLPKYVSHPVVVRNFILLKRVGWKLDECWRWVLGKGISWKSWTVLDSCWTVVGDCFAGDSSCVPGIACISLIFDPIVGKYISRVLSFREPPESVRCATRRCTCRSR